MHTKYADIRKIFMNALKLRGKVGCDCVIRAKSASGLPTNMCKVNAHIIYI